MQDAARTHVTDHPQWKAILLSEQINRRSGGLLVAPWELEQWPDEWLDAYEIILRGVPQTKYRNPLENLFTSSRRKHPSYRKYLS